MRRESAGVEGETRPSGLKGRGRPKEKEKKRHRALQRTKFLLHFYFFLLIISMHYIISFFFFLFSLVLRYVGHYVCTGMYAHSVLPCRKLFLFFSFLFFFNMYKSVRAAGRQTSTRVFGIAKHHPGPCDSPLVLRGEENVYSTSGDPEDLEVRVCSAVEKLALYIGV